MNSVTHAAEADAERPQNQTHKEPAASKTTHSSISIIAQALEFPTEYMNVSQRRVETTDQLLLRKENHLPHQTP